MNAEETFDESLLSAYLDNELEPNERALVEKELARSNDLRLLLSELARVRNIVTSCSIPISPESKVISGPWESDHSSFSVHRPFWTFRSTQLATMAASIALLFGLVTIVFFPKRMGDVVSYQPTANSPSREMVIVDDAPKGVVNQQDVTLESNDNMLKRTIDMPMTETAISPTQAPMNPVRNEVSTDKKSFEHQNGIREIESLAIMQGRANIPTESMKRQPAEELNLPSLQPPAPSVATKHGTDADGSSTELSLSNKNDSIVQKFAQFVMIAEGQKKSKLGKDQENETSKNSLFRFESKAISQTDNRFEFYYAESNGRLDTQTQTVELVIPVANWETVMAKLQEKGFLFDGVKGVSPLEVEEPLLFEATLNKSAESAWAIRALLPDREKWKQYSVPQLSSVSREKTLAVEKDSLVRRIYIVLREEPAKSISNE